MTVFHKEIKVLAFEIEGPNLSGIPIVQTKYDFAIKVDEVVHKPAFMVNTTTQVLFPSNDRIIFGCFVAFFFEEQIIDAQDLLPFVHEARDAINAEIQMKTNSSNIVLQSPDRKQTLSHLQTLILSGYRSN